MKLPEPRGCLYPPILPPLLYGDLEPLPKLTIIPEHVVTPALYMLEDAAAPHRRMIDELMARVHAEDARMRRLLPAPPPGMQWEAELRSEEPGYNFTRNTADMVVRLVYRLRKVDE